MEREIKLSGGEITILKAIGFGGTATHGKMLLERIGEMDQTQFLDDLSGLISAGYVLSDKVNLFKTNRSPLFVSESKKPVAGGADNRLAYCCFMFTVSGLVRKFTLEATECRWFANSTDAMFY